MYFSTSAAGKWIALRRTMMLIKHPLPTPSLASLETLQNKHRCSCSCRRWDSESDSDRDAKMQGCSWRRARCVNANLVYFIYSIQLS